jgi:hypothetical protein
MAKLLVRVGVWLRAGVALTLATVPVCPPLGAQSHSHALFPLAASAGFHKKGEADNAPPVRATVQPTFTIPIEPLGFTPPAAFYLGLRYSLASLDFFDEDHLLLTFRVPGLIHRDHTAGDPSEERKIRAMVLHLPEGTIQADAVWTMHDRKRYLWMLGNGQFLLRDRDNLQVGNANLQLKPFLHFPGPVLWVEMDPDHKYVVTGSSEPPTSASKAGDVASPATAAATLISDDEKPGAEPDLILRILRRDSGKVMMVSRVRSAVHLPINADGYLETIRGNGKSWTLNLNYFSGGNAIVGTVDSFCSPVLDFVSPREFLATTCASGGDSRLVAMTTAGRRLWESPSSDSLVWPLLIASADGSRVVRETLAATHSVSAFAPLGSDEVKGQDVQVFDAASGRVILRALASPVFDAGGNVAVSPSGRRVAIIMADGIQVFDLGTPPPLPDDPAKPARH